MSIKLLTYSGIVTKSKAMKSFLLTREDYEKIAGCSTVSEIIAQLKEHKGYKDIFMNSDLTQIHRGDIEHELIHAYQLTYAKLFKFARIEHRKIMRMLFYNFEIQALRMCLQGIVHAENLVDLSMFRQFFEEHSKIDLQKITAADNIDAFIEALRGTDYYAVLKEVQSIPNPTIFDYETMLNIYFFQKVWDDKDKYLKGKEKKAYTAAIGQQVDLLNIIWIYRFKMYFNTDNGKIMRSIIPIHYRLRKKTVAAMVATESVEELIDLIRKGPYAKLFAEGEVNKDNIEKIYQNYLKKVYERNLRENPMSIVPIQFFLYLKERELDRITTAIECVRYGLPTEETMEILGRQ